MDQLYISANHYNIYGYRTFFIKIINLDVDGYNDCRPDQLLMLHARPIDHETMQKIYDVTEHADLDHVIVGGKKGVHVAIFFSR